jgi:hypothetical protein
LLMGIPKRDCFMKMVCIFNKARFPELIADRTPTLEQEQANCVW